jgi:[NiFe] hydrogenase diaphorase moiety small subunit
MSDELKFIIDGLEVTAQAGQTIMVAADAAGVYIPRLCAMKGISPHGSCRICTVMVNGRPAAACTLPVISGSIVESNTDRLNAHRRNLVEMLFVEGNHFCMFCEKSGNCELQALAYRFGIAAPKYPFLFPKRDLDASHPDVLFDRDRCTLCGRCVRASVELDGKGLFGFVGRGSHKRVGVDAADGLGATEMAVTDAAIAACPTGALLAKRVGYAIPIGQRKYDHTLIGAEIEKGGHHE